MVLVGTSAGGAALNVAGNAAPELVDRLVYVSAWCCVGISTLAEGMAWPEQSTNLFDALTPDNPFDVHSVDTSHAGYFQRPAEFATLLAALA